MKIRFSNIALWIKRKVTHRHESFDKELSYDLQNNYSRTAIVNHACFVTKAKKYLEIGCYSDATFNSVPVLHKIGVDPERGGNLRMTSDEFFAQNKETFDVIFIDGLHIYEQVHKDIVNALKVLNKDGIIILDDMLPLKWTTAGRTPLEVAWLGDCWKCNFEIMATEGLDYKLALCGSGTGIIKPKANHAPLVDLSAEVAKAHFSYLYERHEKLPTIEAKKGIEWMSKSA